MIQTDKDVAIPPKNKYPLSEMGIGDSFFIPTDDKLLIGQRIRSSIQHFKKHHASVKFAVRSVDGGVRCWRIE